MVKRKLSHDEKRVKTALLDGQSMNKAAKTLKIPQQTVRDIAFRLEHLNEICRVPGSTNPISWESPRITPLGVKEGETHLNARYVPFSDGAVDKNDPEMCRVHTAGFYRFQVLKVGTFEQIFDESDVLMGEWTEIVYPRGRADHKGNMYMFGNVVKFAYREGNKGSKTLAVWPKEVWLNASDAKSKGEVTMTSRAMYVSQLLRRYGWHVSNPELRGKIHYAFNNPALAAHYPKGVHIKGAEVYADTSPGEPEVETENADNIGILAYLPTHVRALYTRVKSMEERMDANDVAQDKIIKSTEKTLIIQAQQAQALQNIVTMSSLHPTHVIDRLDDSDKEVLYR